VTDNDYMLRAEDIRWAPKAVRRLEDLDPLLLDDEQFVRYVEALRGELRAMRALAGAGIDQAHKLTTDLRQTQRAHYRLLDQYRAHRAQIASAA
jgi:hypothetical protein